MKKIIQYLLGFLFFVFILEIILLSPVDIKEKAIAPPAAISTTTPHGEQVVQAMEGIHVVESRNESKEWELWADSAVGFKEHGDLSLSKVKASFFSDHGVSFDVVGQRGAVKTSAKDMTVEGDVVTKSSNGYTFKTSSVTYHSALRELKSPTRVEVAGPRSGSGHTLYIEGSEMVADLNKGVVNIERNVKAKKASLDSKNLAVTAERVQLSGRDRSLKFSGRVTIDFDGMRITGPDAMFHYDSRTSQLKSIDLDGGVKVSDYSKWATSEKLRINLAKNEFVFDGSPRVVQDDDELRGDRIVFLDGGRKVKVQNAKIKVSPESLKSKDIRESR